MMIEVTDASGVVAAPVSQTWQILRGILLLIGFIAILAWVGFRSLQRSENRPVLISKWVVSAFMVWVTFAKVGPMALSAPMIGVPLTAGCGLVFAILWRDSIIEIFTKPLTGLFDGGDTEPEPQPLYSIAQARRKQGRYSEAMAEIRKQLESFPNDFQGQFMAAEIQVENLNDLPGADITIQRICNQKSHSAGSIAMALNSLADWHLKHGQDREAARQALKKIAKLLPDSEFSALASQRIGHLAETEHLLGSHERRRLAVKAGVQDIGLFPIDQHPHAPKVNAEKQTVDFVKHLEAHPLDTEAREQLAVLYADHYARLELAAEQLEQLISHPGQPSYRVAHWLSLLADLQLKHGMSYEVVKTTLQRIVDLFPDTGLANTARNRLAHLKLEFRGKEKSQTVKLGSYEQDIGLKARSMNQL